MKITNSINKNKSFYYNNILLCRNFKEIILERIYFLVLINWNIDIIFKLFNENKIDNKDIDVIFRKNTYI